MVSDLLLVAVVAKVFWDLAKSRVIPEGIFFLGSVALVFLLGLSGRWGHVALREGLSGVVLFFFAVTLQAQRALPVYVAFFLVLGLFYLLGKMVHLTWRVVVAAVLLFLGLYVFYRHVGH